MKGKVSKSGFTLVELMVVVAIIGILSAIAIPNFKKYQAKSKTSEAKLQLAALYTAQVSFATDYDVYATCLDTMGYNPNPGNDDESKNNRYYAVGFSAHNEGAINDAYANGATTCTTEDDYFYPGGKKVGGKKAGTADYLGAKASINDDFSEFTAAAGGVLDADHNGADNADLWTINQDKQLSHDNVGY